MRELLKQNNKIELKHLSSGGKEIFKINSLIGEGGACVVYSATRNGRKGLLKEFYPADFKERYNILKRTEKKQLVASGNAYVERFKTMCEEFKYGYDLLEKSNFTSANNLISNYVPEYEIYVGIPENSTIYIWTKQSFGITLKNYISEVWKNPESQTEFKLYNLLTVIKSIALGVCGMHIQGLMHRDIKPDNFLIAKDGMNNINPYQVSMFDVNSFCYGTSSKYIVGTEGYTAPEVKKGQARYYSDIYSLGAVIFSSVVDNEKCYNSEQYPHLERLIDTSELLTNISDIYVKAQLLDLLKKSLAERPQHRYQETELFISDLDKIIVRLLPHTVAKKITNSNQRLKIIEERKPLDAIPIFQDLFYKCPVFQWFPPTDEVNILVIGGGLYGQAFLDVALATLQLRDKKLNVTVVTESPNYDKSIYLKNRPDLERFFDIDKKDSEKDCTSYGSINFVEAKFSRKASESDKIIKRILDIANPCYILVSLGEDILNNTIAKSIVDTGINALVNFVWSGNEKKFKKGNPVYINKSIEYRNIHRDLLQMAFNTHLIWSDSIDADIDMLYNDFKKIYNFKNSIAFALSIQYKLYSAGLTLEEVKTDLAKISFNTNAPEQKKLLKDLSWIEHRRWVTDKVTSGWKAPLNSKGETDTSLCLEFNGNKSTKDKLHLCITKSSTDETPNKTLWDFCDIDVLDPLDKVSVEMYRHYKAVSDEFKRTNYVKVYNRIENIKNSIPIDNAKLLELANEFEFAVNAIVKDENSEYIYKYTNISYQLQKEIENSNIKNNNDTVHRINEINMYLYPLIMASKKTDYKLIDEELIKNMAYIISNRPRPKIAVFFNGGSNADLFKNVVSGMLIIPKSLKYLYYCTPDVNLSKLAEDIHGTLSLFRKKNMKHTIAFVFTFPKKASSETKKLLTDQLSLYGVKAKFYENVNNSANATQVFLNECKNDYLIDISSLPFDDDAENNYCMAQIKKLQHFEYNILENKILNTNCPHLNYLNTSRTKLNVSDLFTLKNSDFTFNNPDISMHYKKLWEIYTGKAFQAKNHALKHSIMVWNNLSSKLNAYSQAHDVIATFMYSDTDSGVERIEKIMPSFCYESCNAIINILLKNNILKSGDIYILNRDSFKINISYNSCYTQIPELFSNYDALSKKTNVVCTEHNNEKTIKVIYNNINVKGIVLDECEYLYLQALADAGFINDLIIIENKPTYCVNFYYSCESIKKILSSDNGVLKTYIYYTLLYNGNFDDIKANTEIQKGTKKLKFDLILIKDNKSVFINCEPDNIENKSDMVNFCSINGVVITISDINMAENINSIVSEKLENILNP